MIPDHLLTEAKPLYLGAVIDDFGCLKNIPTSIKHTNGKYIICNAASAQRDGISIEDYIGLTAHDLGRLTNRKKSVTTNTVEVDKRLCTKEISYATYKHAVLASDQSIVIEEVCKRPVLGSKDQVAAILGCATNITHQAHPMFLFELYESFMPTQDAIKHFLRYKKLDTLFQAPLNREEFLTLIAMQDFQETTLVAKHLNYSLFEVERYQATLREKLPVIGLDTVLTLLQWHSPDITNNVIENIIE